MGVIIPVDFGLASLEWSVVGRPDKVVTTIGYRKTVAGPANPNADANVILDFFWVTGRPSFNSMTSSAYTLLGCGTTWQTVTGPLVGYKAANAVGTAAFTTVPSNSSVLVRKQTARGGRKGRGRLFWPPFNVNEQDIGPTGVIASNMVQSMQIWFDAVMTAVTASNMRFVLLHEDGSAPDDITSFAVQSTLATQRRRMR